MENIVWKIGHDLKLDHIIRAKGTTLTDRSGKTFQDLESGVWCTPLGHCEETVNNAIQKQLSEIAHTGYCYAHPVISETAEKILKITGIEQGKCLFLTSGSEAVEVGVKAIQKTTQKRYILTLHDAFLGSLGSSGNKPEKEWKSFNWTDCSDCTDENTCDAGCRHFAGIDFSHISGFVLEPGSASGLVKFPPEKLVHAIVDRVQADGGTVQINEITTGIGRTGKWFGFQHYNITPDIVSIGKGLGNGYPVSAVAFSSKMIEKMEKHDFYHSQSHQNDPLGAAAAGAVIDAISDQDLIRTCTRTGAYLQERLDRLAKKYHCIKQIRGRGLMIAIEFEQGLEDRIVVDLHNQLVSAGFILAKRPGLNVFRIDPPLNVDIAVLDDFIATFDHILTGIPSSF